MCKRELMALMLQSIAVTVAKESTVLLSLDLSHTRNSPRDKRLCPDHTEAFSVEDVSNQELSELSCLRKSNPSSKLRKLLKNEQ